MRSFLTFNQIKLSDLILQSSFVPVCTKTTARILQDDSQDIILTILMQFLSKITCTLNSLCKPESSQVVLKKSCYKTWNVKSIIPHCKLWEEKQFFNKKI